MAYNPNSVRHHRTSSRHQQVETNPVRDMQLLGRRDRFNSQIVVHNPHWGNEFQQQLPQRMETLRVAARAAEMLEEQEKVGGDKKHVVNVEKPSMFRTLWHNIKRARHGVDTNAPPRYWNLLGASMFNTMPCVGDVYYATSRSFDRPLDQQDTLEEPAQLEMTSARCLRGFRIHCEVDVNGVVGNQKIAHITLTAKRKGACVWAFDGLKRHDLKASAINSMVPSRLRPRDHDGNNPQRTKKYLPQGIVDSVVTADRGFFFCARRKGQTVDLSVVVAGEVVIPRATSWNTDLKDVYQEPLLQALVGSALGMHSRSLAMRMIDGPNTPVAFGVRTLDWMLNHNSQWLAKVRKPLDVVGVEVSALEEVKALHKEWRPVEHRMSEFMYL